MNAALSQHHLLGFEIAQLEFLHVHWLLLWTSFLSPTWLHISRCMALDGWSHHCGYQVNKIFFVQFFCVFLPPLLLLLLGPNHFYALLCPTFHEMFPLVSLIFLNRSLVFPILLFSSISLHCSLMKAFLSLLAILWNSAFKWVCLFFSPLPFTSLFSAICKAASDNHFAFLHFFFLGMVLITASCTVSWISVHSSSGTLSTRSNPLNLFGTSTEWS